MMQLKQHIGLLLAGTIFLLSGCQEEGFEVGGTLEDGAGKTVQLLKITPGNETVVGTVQLDKNGKFYFTGMVDEPSLYKIQTGDNNYALLLIESNEEDIQLDASASDIAATYAISGSPGSVLVHQLSSRLHGSYVFMDSLNNVLKENMQSPNAYMVQMQLNSALQQHMQKEREFLDKFIAENDNSLSLLIALGHRIGEQMLIDPYQDIAVWEETLAKLQKAHPNSAHVKDLASKVDKIKEAVAQQQAQQEAAMKAKEAVSPGNPAPDIELNSPEGKPVALSTLRGKVVLIDFWASWCRPCRMENPNVVRVYNKYKSKGFEIYGVSLDKGKEAWVQAIQQDGLNWIHVSDLAFWNSAAAKLYGVDSIPFTVLVDKDGTIIATGLRSEELEQKLQELLG